MTKPTFSFLSLLLLSCISATQAPPLTPPTPASTDVWIDADTSMGFGGTTRPRDVDDGLAIIQAFHSPELTVRGLSVVFGNCPLDGAVPIAEDLLKRFGPPGMKAHPGAASGDDFGRETDATKALIAELEKRDLHVLALGPFTNIGTVLKARPDLRPKIKSIIVVAGRRPGFDFHPPGRPELKFPDANFEKDIPATQEMIDSGIPIIFAGYEASSDSWVTRADMEKLASKGEIPAWIAKTCDPWIVRWEVRQQIGFNPFDTLAIGWLTHPQLFESIPVTAHITEGPDDRHPGLLPATRPNKPYLICEPLKSNERSRLVYITRTDPKFTQLLLERLAQ